jgi:alpha-L-fucosidase
VLRSQIRRVSPIAFILLFCALVPNSLQAQPAHYEATLESLNQHPLPRWYADAKLGIFIHFGLYS